MENDIKHSTENGLIEVTSNVEFHNCAWILRGSDELAGSKLGEEDLI